MATKVTYPFVCLRANDYIPLHPNIELVQCSRELSCLTLRPSIIEELALLDSIKMSGAELKRAIETFPAKDVRKFEKEFLSETASQTNFAPFVDRDTPQLAALPAETLILVLISQPASVNLPYIPLPRITKSNSFSTATVDKLIQETTVEKAPKFVRLFIEEMEKPRAISEEVCNPPPFALSYCSQLGNLAPGFN